MQDEVYYEQFMKLGELLNFSYDPVDPSQPGADNHELRSIPRMWGLRELVSRNELESVDISGLLYGFLKAYMVERLVYVAVALRPRTEVEQQYESTKYDDGFLLPLDGRRCVSTDIMIESAGWSAPIYHNPLSDAPRSGIVSPLGMDRGTYPVFVLNPKDYNRGLPKLYGKFVAAPHSIIGHCEFNRQNRALTGPVFMSTLFGVYHDFMISAGVTNPFYHLSRAVTNIDEFESAFRGLVDTMRECEKAAIGATIVLTLHAVYQNPMMEQLVYRQQALYYRRWLETMLCTVPNTGSVYHGIIGVLAQMKVVDFSLVLDKETRFLELIPSPSRTRGPPRHRFYSFPLANGSKFVVLERSENRVSWSIQSWTFGLILDGFNIHRLARIAFRFLPEFSPIAQYLFWQQNEVSADDLENEMLSPNNVVVFDRVLSCDDMDRIKSIGEQLYANHYQLATQLAELSSASRASLSSSVGSDS